MHHSHCIHIGYEDNLTNRPRTSTQLQTSHKHTYNIWLQTTPTTRGEAVTSVWKTLCKLCHPSRSQQWGPDNRFLASPLCGPAGWLPMLLIKAGDVETNPGPTTRKQVWICDICHRQIQVRKQISIRCNRIEHWVHLRCAGIRLAQYTDTWTCHQHR